MMNCSVIGAAATMGALLLGTPFIREFDTGVKVEIPSRGRGQIINFLWHIIRRGRGIFIG